MQIEQIIFRYLSIASSIFILVVMMCPSISFFNNTNVKQFHSKIPSPRNFQRFRIQENFDGRFSDIKKRIQRDNTNIKNMCPQYLYKEHKLKEPETKIHILERYSMDNEKKLGWCFNAKVSIAYTQI